MTCGSACLRKCAASIPRSNPAICTSTIWSCRWCAIPRNSRSSSPAIFSAILRATWEPSSPADWAWLLREIFIPGKVSLFEPVHGSAPAIAGKNIANPMGAILAGGMLLTHLGRAAEAQGYRGCGARRDSRRADDGRSWRGRMGTREVGEWIAAKSAVDGASFRAPGLGRALRSCTELCYISRRATSPLGLFCASPV